MKQPTNFLDLIAQIEDNQELLAQFRSQFPALSADQPELYYFDTAATSLRPTCVRQAFNQYYTLAGNLNRSLGIENLQQLINQAHSQLAQYLDATATTEQLVFTQNTTDAINLVASVLTAYYRQRLTALAQTHNSHNTTYYILVATSNHHANLLPWFALSQAIPQIQLVAIPQTPTQALDLEFVASFLQEHGSQCLVASFSSVVNVNGYVNPLAQIKALLDQYAPYCWFMVDNAQGSTFNQIYQTKAGFIDQSWHADFLFGSLHKMYGITGLGYLLFSQRVVQACNMHEATNQAQIDALLQKLGQTANTSVVSNHAKSTTSNIDTLQDITSDSFSTVVNTTHANTVNLHLNQPTTDVTYQMQRLGGGVVKKVAWQNTHQLQVEYLSHNPFLIPGTANINALTTIPTLLSWLQQQDQAALYQATVDLQDYFIRSLLTFPRVVDLRQDPQLTNKLTVQDFDIAVLPCYGHHVLLVLADGLEIDLAQYLAQHNVIVRVGKHCAHPFHQHLNIDASLRLSFAPYNNLAEVDQLLALVYQFLQEYLD